MRIKRTVLKNGKVKYKNLDTKKETSYKEYIRYNKLKINTGQNEVKYTDLTLQEKKSFNFQIRLKHHGKLINKDYERFILKLDSENPNGGYGIQRGDEITHFFGDIDIAALADGQTFSEWFQNDKKNKKFIKPFSIQDDATKELSQGAKVRFINPNGKTYSGDNAAIGVFNFEKKYKEKSAKENGEEPAYVIFIYEKRITFENGGKIITYSIDEDNIHQG